MIYVIYKYICFRFIYEEIQVILFRRYLFEYFDQFLQILSSIYITIIKITIKNG